jgi:hypothetical protein
MNIEDMIKQLNKEYMPPRFGSRCSSIPDDVLNEINEDGIVYRRKMAREIKYGKDNDITSLCKVRILDG